ncbi:hypothetical protein HB790_10925 [Listeria welshimeri]|uniref:DUF2178 domain-containing protein n=1 Tax=Listeria welshimeri TaxID=1643 RepID=A0A7X0T760_LISWE|nr:hypothetical protein [Listeria welshimeri]MBC1244397.1 hypothetical protein [Listeria welshimeri]MBC1323846.1 hypothetical protein [Listeria welshimeri]MBC1364836.1 hypothetical protein [Listeria welshimeri]MBC1396915.1 hypothetical protein [Listeria welshimeri]MBC1414284.1 hypothetical protein [Listeria welshimeri]
MRKYSVKKFIIVFVSMIAAILLFSVITDKEPFLDNPLNLIIAVLIAATAYIITGLFIPKEKLVKEMKEEKIKADERYLFNKGKISYFALLLLASLTPFLLAFLDYRNISSISIKNLAIIFVCIFCLYIAVLQFYKNKK